MPKKELEDYKTCCPNEECHGFITGKLGGKFTVKNIEYTQVVDAFCDTCQLSYSEIFEYWNFAQDEFWVADSLIIPLDHPFFDEISLPGLGNIVNEIDVDAYLYKLEEQMRSLS